MDIIRLAKAILDKVGKDDFVGLGDMAAELERFVFEGIGAVHDAKESESATDARPSATILAPPPLPTT